MSRRALLLLPVVVWTAVEATTYSIGTSYAGTDCSGTPYSVSAYAMEEGDECVEEVCADYNADPSEVTAEMVSYECSTSDYISAMREKFGASPYIIQVVYKDNGCVTLDEAFGYPAIGNCEGSFYNNESTYVIGKLDDNGSASLRFFDTAECLTDSQLASFSMTRKTLDSHSCDSDNYKWYTSKDGESSALSTGAIIGIVCGCVAVVLVVIVLVLLYLRRYKKNLHKTWTGTLATGGTAALEAVGHSQNGLWNDEVIIAKRVRRSEIKVKKLISRGAYGEVYHGVFNGKPVAVKVLIPATRMSLQHVNEFFAEAKMTASMDHPHVVSFVAVAWDSLSDLCVVLEFMDGGDLRSLLDKHIASKRQVGFDRQKATVALHVCHALAYLHSLAPPVIHRDLKSRNILLSRTMEAKVTDFGISRERPDQTMTAGVGTSLWMAPEVMMGEKYDVKADMFSFGVVLSELDVHTLPYAQAKQRSLDTVGRQLTDAALLQKIMTGTARVEFSEMSLRSIVELGYACVAVEPSARPSAAEALYRLQLTLSQEL